MKWTEDSQVKERLDQLLKFPYFDHINAREITVFRSYGSTSRAYARIWGFPKIWQLALKREPHYIIEVISEYFDRQSFEDQTRTLIHELLHIPKKFSGALVPHRRAHRKHNINHKIVDQIYQEYLKYEKI